MSKNAKIILLRDVPGTGKAGDAVEVKSGFARNYLLPKKLAREFNAGIITFIKKRVEKETLRDQKIKEGLSQVQMRLAEESLEIPARAGDEGKLFGSVTPGDITQELSRRGYKIDKRQVRLESPIKSVGDYEAIIALHHDISVKIKVKVYPVTKQSSVTG